MRTKSEFTFYRHRPQTFLAACFLLPLLAMAHQAPAPASLGPFEGEGDVGTVLHPGSASFDATAKTYTVNGSGEDIWASADSFHYVWKKMSGDVTFTADIALAAGSSNHRKGALMIRQSLDPDAAYADVALHGDGLTSLQFREQRGAPTHEIESNVSAPKRLRIQKVGNRFFMWLSADGSDAWKFAGGSMDVPLNGDFYVGLAVCAHDKDATQTGTFSNVSLLATNNPHGTVHNYSTIQTIAIASTDSRVTYVTRDRVDSPSWGPDADTLVFEAAGAPAQMKLTGGAAAPFTGEMPENFGQERSPDNRYVYMNSNRTGTMQIWRSLADGQNAEQLTHDDANSSNPHLSPDGKQLVFLSYPRNLLLIPDNTQLTLKVISLADNTTKVLAKVNGGRNTLGAQPWSPDSTRVAFVTYQAIPQVPDK